MALIDFRARPNTAEYMKMYLGPSSESTWRKFGVPPPPSVSLEEFGVNLRKHGIDRAVFLGRQRIDEGVMTRGVTNDYVAQCVSRLPDQLIGMAGIDPTAGDSAVAELERAITALGLRGVSIDPDAKGIYPDDVVMDPIYAKAGELDVPVVITCGPLVGRWADVDAIDRAAERHPGTTIVCSHGGWPQVTEFIALAYRRDNVYIELSIYEFLPGGEPLVQAANGLIRDRMLYASAFPFNALDTIDRFRQLPFTPEALEALTFINAARILGLDELATRGAVHPGGAKPSR